MAQWFNPKEQTQEGLLLKEVEALLSIVKHKKKKESDKDAGKKGYKSDRGDRTPPELPTPKGDKNKIDKTTEILQEMGIIKAQQEPSVSDSFPEFYNVDGGERVRARGYTTNGMFPDWNDGPKKSIVSEKGDSFAFAKTGYGADGTGLHMHYNDKGGTRATPNIDSIEQKLNTLTKQFGSNNQGIIGEIEGLLKQVKKELDKNMTCNQDCKSEDGCPSCK